MLRDYEVDPTEVLTQSSNRVWNGVLARAITAQAEYADEQQLSIMRGVEQQTQKEVDKGVVRGPVTVKQLHDKFGEHKWRAARRFGVVQGREDDGSDKIRAIDNERGNKLNACSRTYETIAPPNIAFVATVARLFRAGLRAVGCAMLALAFGLDDMKDAYRVVPVSQAGYTVFAVWSFARRRLEYFYLDGHNFGFATAVLNFNAYAKLVVIFARAFLAVPCDQFFDDFLIVDLLKAGSSAQDALAASLSLLGQRHAPPKRKHMARVNVGLGVSVDVSEAHTHMVVRVSPTRERVAAVLATLRQARSANWLLPVVAASVRGKLGFVFSSSAYRFGQAALQPFVQREYFDTDFAFTWPLVEALEFLEFVLPRMRPLMMRLVRDDVPPLIVYTDAMFQWEDEADPLHPYAPVRPLLRIGFVVICPKSGARYFSSYELPLWYFTHFFSRDQATYIAQGEAVGALSPKLSLPGVFKGRSVVQFQDNTVALSALINGYASKGDMGRIVNAFHVAEFASESRTWLDWVPSAANVADLPSRLKFDEMMRAVPGAQWVPTVLPSLHEWLMPFDRFAGDMLAFLSSSCEAR